MDPLTTTELHSVQKRLTALVPAFAKKLAPVYAVLDWEWGGLVDGEGRVPVTADIERSFVDLIRDMTRPGWLANDGVVTASTGGLSVNAERLGDGSVYSWLGFDMQEAGEYE